jgi:hypothetical protein
MPLNGPVAERASALKWALKQNPMPVMDGRFRCRVIVPNWR